MPASRSAAVLSSSEKKRLRDRRAQATLREKRQNRIQQLEDRVAFCEKNHNAGADAQSAYVRELLRTVERLRIENNRLRERQEHLRQMVRSWEMIDQDDDDGKSTLLCGQQDETHSGASIQEQSADSNQVAQTEPQSISTISYSYTPSHSSMSTDSEVVAAWNGIKTAETTSPPVSAASPMISDPSCVALAHSVVSLPSTEGLPPTAPAWSRVPLNKFETNNTLILPVPKNSQWYGRPDLIIASPVQASPLDFLYGTRRNFLASRINQAVRKRAFRDAECLALGYLIYNFSRWRTSPTPATFARLAKFQHPTEGQIRLDHMAGIDLVIWPQLRVNLIRHWQKYDLIEMIDYISCCCKVRWPWGKEMLERDADDNLQVSSDFQKVFMSEEGWGLTVEFIDKYPELLEGMDVEALRFEITLPSEIDAY